MRRRTVALGALALLVGGGLAWAVRFDPALLRSLHVENRSDEAQTVDLQVSADGSVEFETTVSLDPDERRTFPCSWPSYANSYLLEARTAGTAHWPHAWTLDRGSAYHRSVVYAGGPDSPWRLEEIDPAVVGPSDGTVCEVPGWVDDLRGV